eukprot:314876-Amphidinium_carterae.1
MVEVPTWNALNMGQFVLNDNVANEPGFVCHIFAPCTFFRKVFLGSETSELTFINARTVNGFSAAHAKRPLRLATYAALRWAQLCTQWCTALTTIPMMSIWRITGQLRQHS